MTGCCHLSVFMEDFDYYFAKQFKFQPSTQQIKNAKRDWRAGSTGWEAVQIALERIREDQRKAGEKPLVNIGGNNYAYADSDLALRYGGKQMTPQDTMRLAHDALEETRNALAWFYDSYPEDVTPKGNKLLPHVETVLTALRSALSQQSRIDALEKTK